MKKHVPSLSQTKDYIRMIIIASIDDAIQLSSLHSISTISAHLLGDRANLDRRAEQVRGADRRGCLKLIYMWDICIKDIIDRFDQLALVHLCVCAFSLLSLLLYNSLVKPDIFAMLVLITYTYKGAIFCHFVPGRWLQ